MAAKDVRNIIVSLVILIIGIQLIVFVLKAYIPATAVDVELINFDVLSSIANGVSIAIGLIVILLVPVYVYKRGKD